MEVAAPSYNDNGESNLTKRVKDALSFTGRILSSMASVVKRIFFSRVMQLTLTIISVAQQGTSTALLQNVTDALRSVGIATSFISTNRLLFQAGTAILLGTALYSFSQALLWIARKGYNTLSFAITKLRSKENETIDNNNEHDVDLINRELPKLPLAGNVALVSKDDIMNDVLGSEPTNIFLPLQSAPVSPIVNHEENAPISVNRADDTVDMVTPPASPKAR